MATNYRFHTCDVFTETRFGGNPLAVFPDARGLSDQQMQQITREFNYSESTFVFPPEAGHTRKVRIFTPAREVPFAGHPNVGTAFVLGSTGALGELGSSQVVTFEEQAGLVPITIEVAEGRLVSCELQAPQQVSIGQRVAPELIARAVSLVPADFNTKIHQPQEASVGLPFIFVELASRAALERARINPPGFDAVAQALEQGNRASIYLYARVSDGVDIRVRMFAPLSGVWEDPATGSAGCAVAGLLTHYDARDEGNFAYRIAQGVEMGRPSLLLARARKSGGAVTTTWIGGASVLVSEGRFDVG